MVELPPGLAVSEPDDETVPRSGAAMRQAEGDLPTHQENCVGVALSGVSS